MPCLAPASIPSYKSSLARCLLDDMKRKLILAGAGALIVLAAIIFIAGKDGWGNNRRGGRSPIVVTSNGTITLQPETRGTMMVVYSKGPPEKTNTSPGAVK